MISGSNCCFPLASNSTPSFPSLTTFALLCYVSCHGCVPPSQSFPTCLNTSCRRTTWGWCSWARILASRIADFRACTQVSMCTHMSCRRGATSTSLLAVLVKHSGPQKVLAAPSLMQGRPAHHRLLACSMLVIAVRGQCMGVSLGGARSSGKSSCQQKYAPAHVPRLR